MRDPAVITERDIDEFPGPWVACEWGYRGCYGYAYASDMIRHDGGFMCSRCYATAEAEYEDFIAAAKYDRRPW